MVGSKACVHLGTTTKFGVHHHRNLASNSGVQRGKERTERVIEIGEQQPMPVVAVAVTTLVFVRVEPAVVAVNHAGTDLGIYEVGSHDQLTFDIRRSARKVG